MPDTFGGQKRYERSVCAQKDPQCRNQRLSKTQQGSSSRKLCFVLVCPRSARRTSDVSRTAQVKERKKQVHPSTPFLFAASQEAHIILFVMCNDIFFVKAQREPLQADREAQPTSPRDCAVSSDRRVINWTMPCQRSYRNSLFAHF